MKIKNVTYKNAFNLEYLNNNYEVIYQYTDTNYSGYFIAKKMMLNSSMMENIFLKSMIQSKIISIFSDTYPTTIDEKYLSYRPKFKFNPNEAMMLETPLGLIKDEQLFSQTNTFQNSVYLVDVPEYFNYPDSPIVNFLCSSISYDVIIYL